MSKLQLNVPVLDYKAFPHNGSSSNTQQMPLLIAEGRTPLSVVGLMKQRLEILAAYKNVPKELKSAYEAVMKNWWDNYFDTGDGAVRHSDGRLKVVHDALYLRQISPQTRLVDGAVPLGDVYNGLEGQEFTTQDVERYFNKPLSRREAVDNPGWLALFRGDKVLQKEAVGVTFAQSKERFGYDGKMMGIYHGTVPKEGAAGRLWFVGGLGGIGSSRAGGGHLDLGSGRLVGVAPEAQRAAAGRTLEQRV